MDAVFSRMNNFGRMPLCGMISTYNDDSRRPGPSDFARVLMNRLTIRGFIIIDYLPRAGEAFAELVPWVASGQLKWKVHVGPGPGERHGLGAAPVHRRSRRQAADAGLAGALRRPN